jgi:TonB family protein
MSGISTLKDKRDNAGDSWKRSLGRTVAGKFLLVNYLSGTDDAALFLTSSQHVGSDSKEAVVKLMYAAAPGAEKQLRRWNSARQLSHPNLIRVFDAGRCEIDGTQLLYSVQEYAEENLAQILPERALTAEETREMLPPVLKALQYLHVNGLAHGDIQPANIHAIGNEVKLSSDSAAAFATVDEKSSPGPAGKDYDPPEAASGAVSSAADIWRLGVTLIEVLTQQLPVWDRARSGTPEISRSLSLSISEPFREIIKRCLEVEPSKRWSVAQILSRLDPALGKAALASPAVSPASGPTLVRSEGSTSEKVEDLRHTSTPVFSERKVERQESSARWPYLIVAIAVIAIAIVVAITWSVRTKRAAPGSETQAAVETAVQSQADAGANSSPVAKSGKVAPIPTQTQSAGDGANLNNGSSTTASPDGVVHRVVPDVSPSARRTIHGRIVVRVKVKVDGAGDVAKATVVTSHASKYFGRLAFESAREWKFVPEPATGQSADRQWNLQFAFTRSKTEVAAAVGR